MEEVLNFFLNIFDEQGFHFCPFPIAFGFDDILDSACFCCLCRSGDMSVYFYVSSLRASVNSNFNSDSI